MEKKGVMSISNLDFDKEMGLKQLILFFDKLYIRENTLEDMHKAISNPYFVSSIVSNNKREIEYLSEIGFIDLFTFNLRTPSNDYETSQIVDVWEDILSGVSVKDNEEKHPRMSYEENDLLTRLGYLSVYQFITQDVIPILKSTKSFSQLEKTSEIINLTINKIPIPTNDTPWEKIIDFKNDKDTRSKYLALINWINNVSISEKTICHINEEFEYLYDQYQRHYDIHKIKKNYTWTEILINSAIDILTKQGHGIVKELFSIRKTRLSLLEEELKLPGSEVAYIFKANETF
jgi:hypothetical protein